MQKSITHFFLILSLLGCVESEFDIGEICKAYPETCYKINLQDGQCDIEKNALIKQRYITLQMPTDLNKFDELIATKKFAQCMETAGQFTTATLKETRSERIESLYQAYDAIKQIEQELAESYQPSIIFYRWTQGDEQALKQFLALEGTEQLQTPTLQLALATHYIKNDKDYSLAILLNALSLYDGKDKTVENQILPEIIKTLATINHAKGRLEHAYFWALVGKEFGVPLINNQTLNRMYPLTENKIKKINLLSISITKKIHQGQFHPQLLQDIDP